MMTFMSEGEAGLPFRLASITRRQISTVAWSPRSFAASRTSQAASSGFSGFDSSVFAPGFLPKRWPAAPPNRIAFIADIPHPLSVRSSLHGKRGLPLGAGIGASGMLARLIELQDAAGCLDVEAAKFAFQIVQVLGGDAGILCAKEQEPPGRGPPKVPRLGQHEQHLPNLVQQGPFGLDADQ